MNEVTVMIGSVTYAIKAQKALAAKGIRASIIKNEHAGSRGCTYGLRLAAKDSVSAEGILKLAGIKYSFESEDKR